MDYSVLYDRYKDSFTDDYAKAKAAIADGFDLVDIKVAADIAQNLLKVVNELQENLSLDDKKGFIVYMAMKLYYEQELPWYLKIGFVKYFIKKKITKLVDGAIDYLNEKGIVKESDL